VEYAITAAHKAGVKKLLLFHHDPNRSDDELRSLLDKYRSRIKGKSSLEIDVAREGVVWEV
ncbi:MAG: MBL fold metallo-hydrolase, partial [Spirochaetaceae bacterium]